MFKKFLNFKLIVISFLVLNFFSQMGICYQTALITYPENNKNWKQVYFGKQDKEVISQWIPSYSQSNDWAESVVFHAYNWAKGNSSYRLMMNLLTAVESKNSTMRSLIVKDDYVDSIAVWCAEKTQDMPAQCEIVRVTSAYEGLVSIHYINKNPEYFLNYQKDTWLDIIRNIRIYYSHYRWDKVLGKEKAVQLQ